MSDRYKGAILSATPPTVIPQSAGGIYTSSQQLQYQGQSVWPQAVNNPVTRSLRFRRSASAYLNRTPASAGNRRTWTWSGWVKRGQLGVTSQLFVAGYPTISWFVLGFGSDDTLQIAQTAGSSASWKTAAVFRDPSAWYHVVCVVDTTSATSTMNGSSTDRFRLYVNNVQYVITSGTIPSQNSDLQVNNTISHTVNGYSGEYFDGYLTEVYLIDGLALTPSSFGSTNAYGVWQPIPYTGTYGTNGFYLPFTDNSALTTSTNVGLGKDFSGNSNYWTTNNISITSGSTYDSMTDVPTLTNSTTANYCVLNPLQIANPVVAYSISNGNLQLNSNSGSTYNCFANGTIFLTSGKWYAEFTQTSGTRVFAGISRFTDISTPNNWNASSTYYINTGEIQKDGSTVTTGATWTTNDVIGVAYDADAATCAFYKNNTLQGTVTGVTAGTYSFSVNGYQSGVIVANFGQRPFAYTPPTGFYALNTYNLPTPTILAGNQYFDVSLWTGNGTSQSITNSGSMQPDFVWYKGRSTTYNHGLFDSIRGTLQRLSSNLTSAESTTAGSLTAFNSNGFSIGNDAGANQNTDTYVGWQWRASNAAGVSNTQGTITSTVSANTTAGFSIVTYTGTGSNATVGHGLGVAPSFIIVKRRNSAADWMCYHISIGNNNHLILDTTAAAAAGAGAWNATSPTSTVFSIGNYGEVNVNTGTYVAYCFAQVAGYSAFGSYTGNGSTDGPFVYLGFRPKYILIKCSSTGGTSYNWALTDSVRSYANVANHTLAANLSDASSSFGTGVDVFGPYNQLDLLSNGFKIRDTGVWGNANGATYIYACFAENPFKIANAR